jgi:TRAP transporter TAXI family solute receptor
VRLSIATGNTGGVYSPYGGGLAKIIGESLRVQATAEVTAATVDNLKLIQQRKVDIAFALADTLDDAVRGQGPFQRTGAVKARALAVLYPNYTHVATIGGNGIERLADLRGRVVSTGSPGSGTEVIAFRVLRAAGLDPDRDIRLRLVQCFQEMRDDGTDGLIAALGNTDYEVRKNAVQGLGALGPSAERVVAHLVPLLEDSKNSVRFAAQNALKQIQPAQAEKWKAELRMPAIARKTKP